MTDILNPFALIAHRDDRHGFVKVARIVIEAEKNVVDDTGLIIMNGWVVTRSMDRARMELVRAEMVKAWLASSETLGAARIKLEADFETLDAGAILDVPRTIDNAMDHFAENRQRFWRHAIDTLRAHPIDPVAGIQPGVAA